MRPLQSLTILGSTGSIGVNTLDVVARHPDRFRVVALSAHSNVDRLFEQCSRFQPRYAVLVDGAAAAALRDRVRDAGVETKVLAGAASLEEIARLPEVDSVMAAIVGCRRSASKPRRRGIGKKSDAREQGSAGHGGAALH